MDAPEKQVEQHRVEHQVVSWLRLDARYSRELWRWTRVLAGNQTRLSPSLLYLVHFVLLFCIFNMNVSGTLNFFRLLRDPSLCLPHHTVPTFNHLPVPLSRAFNRADGDKRVDIKAVVLDKDNCFAVPKENEVYKPYAVGQPRSLSRM